jgi:DMSO/TMAO reductase YedYZ molybdopterin-dependent catalytic subunit
VKLFPDNPPPGPFRSEFWRSPLRGPWLTSVLGACLLVAVPVVALTGLLSHAAYNPDLGNNRITGTPSIFDTLVFDWPTSPAWLYVVTQGLHVTLGVATMPILLAKLWSVIPKLWEWPPVRSPAHALERLTLALLVGGALFQFVTGVLNIQVYYPWKFDFVIAHYYGAWVFLVAFFLHVALKLGTVRQSLRERSVLAELRTDLEATRSEERPADPASEVDAEARRLVASRPDRPTMSRRGVLALAGGSSLGLAVMLGGQVIGGPARKLALLAPRSHDLGDGPNDFPVNKTARSVKIERAQTGAQWRLQLAGERDLELARPQLLALPQSTYHLPIACVEGWSTTQSWAGVRLRELAAMAGAPGAAQVLVESLEQGGKFSQTTLSADQIDDERSLLALKVNGADLSLDHGFPARIIVPALPGVHCTKWVAKLTFARA